MGEMKERLSSWARQDLLMFFYLLREIEAKSPLIQLSWIKGSENKVPKKEELLTRGTVQRGMHISSVVYRSQTHPEPNLG